MAQFPPPSSSTLHDGVPSVPEDYVDQFLSGGVPPATETRAQSADFAQQIKTLKNIVQIERQLRHKNDQLTAQLRERLARAEMRSTVELTAAPQHEDMTVLMPRQATQTISSLSNTVKKAQLTEFRPMPEQPSGLLQTLSSMTLPEGYMLFEYRIDGVLGQGGFGVTYLATDINLNARVAIKEYLPTEFSQRASDYIVTPRTPSDSDLYQAGLDRFLIEARTLASFRHPNIVRVARFFEIYHTAYLVLEYEIGHPLKKWWQEHANMPEQDLLTLLHPLLDGLALVHESGFLHRDIKPDNIYVRKENGSLVLLDFGSARETLGEVDMLSNVLTPGYAPIEQYEHGGQGPWTDIYAFGATLYWMVAGVKPPPAPSRLQTEDPMEPAVAAGHGRYSKEFLQAIDWALKPRSDDRPQDIGAFSRALFSAHAGSLGLQEALQLGEKESPVAESWRSVQDSPRRVQQGLAWFFRALTRPASWPLVVKMSLAMLLTSIFPMILSAYYNWHGSVESLSNAETDNLQRIASSAAGRVSQLLNDSRGLSNYLATDTDFTDLLTAPSESNRAAVKDKIDSLVKTIPEVYSIILLDAQGQALVTNANNQSATGRNFGFRDYFRNAISGQAYMSGMTLGSLDGISGVYYSNPILAKNGQVLGVIVFRIKGSAIAAILEDVTQKSDRRPFLVDTDGILIYYADKRFLYQSLAPLEEEKRQRIMADQRFGKDNPIKSLNMPVLAQAVVGAGSAGSISYGSTMSGQEEVAGYAPLSAHQWVVGITESRAVFEAPLNQLFTRVLTSVLLIGLVFFFLALLFSRSIVRPIQQLTQAALALKRGDYKMASIQGGSDDEIGRLVRTFNVMVDVLRQRDRERARNSKSRE